MYWYTFSIQFQTTEVKIMASLSSSVQHKTTKLYKFFSSIILFSFLISITYHAVKTVLCNIKSITGMIFASVYSILIPEFKMAYFLTIIKKLFKAASCYCPNQLGATSQTETVRTFGCHSSRLGKFRLLCFLVLLLHSTWCVCVHCTHMH